MERKQFERVFEELTSRQKEVLKAFLAGDSDEKIANSLCIEKVTVRQHIRNILIKFNIKSDSERDCTSQRHRLSAVFTKYKPELVEKEAVEDCNLPESITGGQADPALDFTDSDFFVGRTIEIQEIERLAVRNTKVILIQGLGGVGKTTLAKRYLLQKFGKSTIEFTIAKEARSIASVEELIAVQLQELGEEPGREFQVSLERLKQKLRSAPMGVLIDNLEPTLDGRGKFIEPHRQYVELIRALADPTLRSITLITSREPLCEVLDVEIYRLLGLGVEDWQTYFRQKGIEAEGKSLEKMHRAYGGNALAMQVLCNPIKNYYDGDVTAYWQENCVEEGLPVELAVENLIQEQFDRLQTVCPDAYRLLCRMGCYRYQDVEAVPLNGLRCLLWDIEKVQHARTIRALQDRNLIERANSEYYLHPVIRAEAIRRLRASEDWEKANREAATFWTDSVDVVKDVDDAQRALEAYYHYLEIQDFEACAGVVVEERDRWNKSLDIDFEIGEETTAIGSSGVITLAQLGVEFYRFGLLTQIRNAIDKIIDEIEEGYASSRLFNILGDVQWITGCVLEAIKSHIKSREIAKKHGLKALEIVSFFNVGLCYIDSWDLAQSEQHFKDVIFYSEDTLHNHYSVDSYCCMAFLKSCPTEIKNFQEAYYYIDRFRENLSRRDMASWSIGYRMIFLGLTYQNLGEFQESFEIYHRAIKFAEHANYTQVKAKSLCGLGGLYREQKNFEQAVARGSEAIKLLDRIGAKCDLAEAYYQLALTHQAMQNSEESQANFDRAIKIWQGIDAPKQIERVRQSMVGGG